MLDLWFLMIFIAFFKFFLFLLIFFFPSLFSVLLFFWRLTWGRLYFLFVMKHLFWLFGLFNLNEPFDFQLMNHFLFCSFFFLPSDIRFIGFNTDWLFSFHLPSLIVIIIFYLLFFLLRKLTHLLFHFFRGNFIRKLPPFYPGHLIFPKDVNLLVIVDYEG